MSDLTSAEQTTARNLSPAQMYGKQYVRPQTAGDSANGSSVTGDTTDDRDYDVINSYNFVLRIEGFQNIPLRAVRGINKQNEYEYIQEGGLNDYVHMVRKPISQPFTFQVERYVSQDWLQDAIDPLANGTELLLPVLLYMYRSNAHDDTSASRCYVFTNCRVTGVQVGDLDSEKSGLHTITNTIAYSQMTIISIPFAGIDEKGMYRFNKENIENKENTSHVKTLKDLGITRIGAPLRDKASLEEAVTSAENNYRGNRTKVEMKALGNKYAFSGAEGNAANTQNLKNTVVQEYSLDKAKMKEKSIKYEFTQSLPAKDDKGNDTTETKINNTNTDRVVVQAANRAHVYRKFDPKEEKTRSANDKNTANAKGKSELKSDAKKRKYQFRNEDVANNVNIEGNIAPPKSTPTSKEGLERIAAKNKYQISWDKETANNINTDKVAEPEKKPVPKTNMEKAAKKNKYVFKDGKKANTTNLKNTVGQGESQLSKEDMKGEAEKYKFKSKKNTSGLKKSEVEISKRGMIARAEMYNRHSHFVEQDNESKKSMEAKAKKYPPTRSARDVTEFLNRNR